MSAPPPAAVRGNDWRSLPAASAADFVPALGVSVVVPCRDRPGPLALTLAGLAAQDYPKALLEVVVVDDGSRPPLDVAAPAGLRVRAVRLERCGFGLARARNAGVRAARGPVVVFLDADVVPEAGLVAAHARWHHAAADALTLGLCRSASAAGVTAAAVRERRGALAELFAGRPSDPPWNARHLVRTDDLAARRDDLFRAVGGGNLGVSRAFFDELGGFDAAFSRYGGEDTEFGYRAQAQGAVLVPVRDALGWHQGRWAEDRARKRGDQARQAPLLAQRIPDPGFRPAGAARAFAVPRHAVTVAAGDAPREGVLATVEALLADPAGDLAVRVELPPPRDRGDDADWLAEQLDAEPRARLGGPPSTAAFPAATFHAEVPVGAPLGPGCIARLRDALGDAAVAEGILRDGSRVRIARAWAVHRARRTGRPASDFGDVRALDAAKLLRGTGRRRARRAPRTTVPAARGAAAAAARVLAEARHVRGPRTAWRFLGWLAGAARWRLREPGRPWPASARPRAAPPPRGDPALGAEIATLGPAARAAFRASSRVAHGLGGHADAVLADTRALAARARAPVVALDEAPGLAVPALDPARDNPVGWVRDVEPRVAALGPRRLLPDGVAAHREAAAADREALLRCHHVVDVAAFHADPASRAGALARIAAWGVPVHVADADPALAPLLGAELWALVRAPIRTGTAAAREALSVRMRRAALDAHGLRARARQVCAAAGVPAPPAPPTVSVLLATRRPAWLCDALANVARQGWPRLELVLALHGPGFAEDAVAAALAGLAVPATVLRLDAALPLGAVLNAAGEAAGGALVAKMDDDDVYGAEHVRDLVLAHEYSGAALLGKTACAAYLAGSGRTVRQRPVPAETWSRTVAGGTLLMARDELARVGGWRRVACAVDQALVADVARAGGGVYRTHGLGYLAVRHGAGHAWAAADDDFLAGAECVRAGWHPALAGIDPALAPPAAALP